MVHFTFNERRATQAAAFFLSQNGGVLNYTKLIKLLYLADRMSILRWHEPITGDNYFSLPYGPVVSTILDKISNGPRFGCQDFWSNYIKKADCDSYSVRLSEPIEYDELSKRELDLLLYLDDRFKSYDQWAMVDYCHKYCEEWDDPNGSNKVISIEDILEAELSDPDEIESILTEMKIKSSIIDHNTIEI